MLCDARGGALWTTKRFASSSVYHLTFLFAVPMSIITDSPLPPSIRSSYLKQFTESSFQSVSLRTSLSAHPPPMGNQHQPALFPDIWVSPLSWDIPALDELYCLPQTSAPHTVHSPCKALTSTISFLCATNPGVVAVFTIVSSDILVAFLTIWLTTLSQVNNSLY